MLGAGHGAKMIGADSSQAGYFVFGERLLCGFDGDHSQASFCHSFPALTANSLGKKPQAEKRSNTKPKQYSCRLHWPVLAAHLQIRKHLELNGLSEIYCEMRVMC